MNTQSDNPQIESSVVRPRRLRYSPGIRKMVRQTFVTANDLIFPLFVTQGEGQKNEIKSMPGQFQFSLDRLNEEIESIVELGIPAVMLFGIPESKDASGSGSYAEDGIIQQATREIKKSFPELVVVTDLCLCEYTDHGHCGIVNRLADRPNPHLPEDAILNDETLAVLARIALSQARAGADMVAPSGMMDSMVSTIRQSLDQNGFDHLPIMSYAVKFASAFYGPFRDAADGAPQFGDRKTHQMDPANLQQVDVEAEQDIQQGADFLMVKPALAYLDIVSRLKQLYPGVPLVAYNVSGEYAMIKAAAANGWIDETDVVTESLTGMKRAGADLLITYHAKDYLRWQNS